MVFRVRLVILQNITKYHFRVCPRVQIRVRWFFFHGGVYKVKNHRTGTLPNASLHQ